MAGRFQISLDSQLPVFLKDAVIFSPLFLQTPTGKPCYTCFISIYWHWWSKRASPGAICEITETTECSESCQRSLWASPHDYICLFVSPFSFFISSKRRGRVKWASDSLSYLCFHWHYGFHRNSLVHLLILYCEYLIATPKSLWKE